MDEKRRAAKRPGRVSVGHPVDVATGTLFHDFQDLELPGKAPLIFARRYSSALAGEGDGMFGPGWTSPFEVRLMRDLDGYRMVDEDGETEVCFDDPRDLVADGGTVRDLGAFCELRQEGALFVVTRWSPAGEDVTRYLFRPGEDGGWWPLLSRQDAAGQGVDIRRDSAGRVATIKQRREGRGLRLTYNDAGRVVEVHVTTPATTFEKTGDEERERFALRLGYDDRGFLSEVTDALQQRSRYWYTPAGYMTRERTLGGMVYTFSFDGEGRCVETAGADDFGLERLEHQPVARVTVVNNSFGQQTTYQYNENGQVTSHISPQGGATATEFDEYGRIVSDVDPVGGVTTYEFDERGDLAKVVSPDGAETAYGYNDLHQVTSINDPEQHIWLRTIDPEGRLSALTNPLEERLSFGYDPRGDLSWIEDGAGNRCSLVTSPGGDLLESTDWCGNTTAYEYDREGRLTAIVDALGHRTEGKLDTLGRIRQLVLPDGARRSYGWNAHGQMVEYTDERGQTTRWRYEACGLVSEIAGPHGGRTCFHWSAIPGQLVGIVNHRGERYSFEYDADGGLLRETDFAGRRTEYERDARGQVATIIDPAGRRSEITRDPGGAVTLVAHDDGTEISYHYTPRGLLSRADNGQCPVERTYDAAGRMVAERQGDNEVRSDYDSLGSRIRRRSSVGLETSFAWDANGMMTQLTAQGQAPLRFEYDAAMKETARFAQGGVRIDLRADARGRTVEQVVSRQQGAEAVGGEPVARVRYSYDAASNLTEVAADSWGPARYTYDMVGRVVDATLPGGLAERFEYDTAGNVVASGSAEEASDGPVLAPWDYSPGDVLVRRGDTLYAYDEAGQMVSKAKGGEVTRFSWNRQGQLEEVTLPDQSTWRYRYDAFGRRVKKSGPGRDVEYVWDEDVVLHELASEGQLEPRVVNWEFDPHGFAPLCKVESGSQYLCANDPAGNPRQLVAPDGDVVWSGSYSTWGEVDGERGAGVDCPVRYQGQWYDDETGLHYNRYRYYDPEAGRFISQDPVGLLGGMNVWTYADNTTGWIDPFGLTDECPPTTPRGRGRNRVPDRVSGRPTAEQQALIDMARSDSRRMGRGRGPISAGDADAYVQLANETGVPVRAKAADLSGAHGYGPVPAGPDAAHIHINGEHVPVPPGYTPPPGSTVIQ